MSRSDAYPYCRWGNRKRTCPSNQTVCDVGHRAGFLAPADNSSDRFPIALSVFCGRNVATDASIPKKIKSSDNSKIGFILLCTYLARIPHYKGRNQSLQIQIKAIQILSKFTFTSESKTFRIQTCIMFTSVFSVNFINKNTIWYLKEFF